MSFTLDLRPMRNNAIPIFSISLSILSSSVLAAPLPTKVGQCSNTTVKSVGTRLEDGTTHEPLIGSGSAITFTNGGYQVTYDTVAAVESTRSNDKVKLCLQSIPHPCPPGDNRGRFYTTLNYRTGKTWVLPDAQHLCGGRRDKIIGAKILLNLRKKVRR